MVSLVIQRLLLYLFLAICFQEGQAWAKPALSSIKNTVFYQPTASDLQDVHGAFVASTQSLNGAVKNKTAAPKTAMNITNVTAHELSQARKLVAQAHASQAAYNKWNIENPRFNNYEFKQPQQEPKRRRNHMSPPRFSQDILDAIKLVGNVDAQDMHNNGTLQKFHDEIRQKSQANHKTRSRDTYLTLNNTISKRDGGGWFLGQVDHSGTQPFGGNSSYKVWRNVMDYGAVGDGVHDDTEAIQQAIADGSRCGSDCAGSTVTGAVVYLPIGVYRVSSSIVLYFNTQLVGEHEVLGEKPVIQAATSFTGNGLFSTDVYLADGTSEWYVNTANFYRQLRNLNIDMRLATLDSVKAIHWQVAQATSIDYVDIYLTDKSSSTQIGIFAENGSGGWFSDINIAGGLYGFLGGNQQYSVAYLGVSDAKNCMGLIWDWAWSWTQLSLMDCDVGIDLTAPGSNSAAPVGSVMLVDSYIARCTTAIKTYHSASSSSEQGTTVLSLNNFGFMNCTYFIAFPDGSYLQQSVSNWNVDYWQMGELSANGQTSDGFYTVNVTRPASLTYEAGAFSPAGPSFFRRSKPLYLEATSSTVVNAKVLAKGDGVTDDSAALQTLLNYCAQNNYLLYIPAGSYMIANPILIPNNSYIFGEAWSQFVAYGSKFNNEDSPAPMVTVGQGETDGVVEIQNLLFTSQGALPGLVLVQWNIQAGAQGSVGLWDCHFRVGGALGTDLQVANCPKLTGSVNSQCTAGSIMLLLTGGSNGYFENMWAWVADHDIDYPASDASNQIDVYFTRGVLIQGDGPNWFRGTASEHSTFYQYNLVNASNVYMSMIQTESPYYQGAPETQAPAPFTTPLWVGDPVFDMCGSDTTSCNMAWSIIVQWSDSIFIDGAGLYSWFQNYNESCVNTNSCQQRLINIFYVGDSMFNHIVTIGSVEILTPAISNTYNDILFAADYLQATSYPWWTTIATYLDSSAPIDRSSAPYPIKEGWVCFGDSYAAGIGAGKPYDKDVTTCARGTGGYPVILNDIIQFSHDVTTNFQLLACSGETAQQFIDDAATKQIDKWQPSFSDIGTVSFTGNDLGFGDIVAHCIMGYKSRDNCQKDIANAKSILDGNQLISGYVFDVMDKIRAKANPQKRFVVYWTGYPRFFSVVDSTCDTCWFHEWWYAGEYLTQELRNQLNELSVQVNTQLAFAIRRYNAGRPYPAVVFVSPEDLGNIYEGHRFCEKGVQKPLKGTAQNAVAFFYEKGPDDVPDSPFRLPSPRDGAPGDWQLQLYNSATCDDNIPLFEGDWGSDFICDAAKGIANGTISASEYLSGEGDNVGVIVNNDGSVTIAELDVSYTKMFHPKTRANWHIAQAVYDALRAN